MKNYNTKTKNTSFINVWRFFQDQEFDDPIFMLRLNNKNLENFNLEDFKDDDDVERRNIVLQAVMEECKNNIWFFFREVVRVGSSVSNITGFHDFDSMYILTPNNALLIRAYEQGKSFILHQANDEFTDLNMMTMNLLMLYNNFFKETPWNKIEYGNHELFKKYLINPLIPSSVESLKRSNYKFFTSVDIPYKRIEKKVEDYFNYVNYINIDKSLKMSKNLNINEIFKYNLSFISIYDFINNTNNDDKDFNLNYYFNILSSLYLILLHHFFNRIPIYGISKKFNLENVLFSYEETYYYKILMKEIYSKIYYKCDSYKESINKIYDKDDDKIIYFLS